MVVIYLVDLLRRRIDEPSRPLPPRGDLPLAADLRPAAGAGTELELRLALPEPGPWDEEGGPPIRVSLGPGGPESPSAAVEHRRRPGTVDGRQWAATVEIPAVGEAPWLAVVVEDLETGSWGARLVELE